MNGILSLLGKPVLDLKSASIIGHVKKVYFDETCKSVRCFSVSCEDAEMTLDFDKAVKIADSIVIEDAVSLKHIEDADITQLKGNMIGMSVYCQTGAYKGDIKDIIISSAGKVIRIEASSESFAPSQITGIGNILLKKPTPRLPSKPKQTRVMPMPDEDLPVYIVNTPPTVALSNDAKEPVFSQGAFNALLGEADDPLYEEDPHNPTRIICDYEFLLGRTLGADLTTYTGELLAVKGSEVTATTVEMARRAGKLVELTLNSIKK